MIEAGHCRSAVNALIHRIRRVFKWAVENEYVSAAGYTGLATVASLKRGRSAARESAPVLPVSESTVASTLPFLPRVGATVGQLQLLTGARPGERGVRVMRSSTWTSR